MSDLVLLGGGGHAAVVADSARQTGWNVTGFYDDRPDHDATQQVDLRWLGEIPERIDGDVFVHAAVGDAALRGRWLGLAGDRVATAITAPTAIVSTHARLAPGVFVGPGAVVNARTTVGRGAIVNSGAIVEHDCELGPLTHVGPGAVLGGAVAVEAEAMVGLGARILPSIRIGAGATVAAGAVVVSDVPPGATVAGVPARPLPAATQAGV